MSTSEMRTQDTAIGTTDLTGYEVEATDGGIGSVDEATNDVGGSYIVVDTGPWIFGKKVLLPGRRGRPSRHRRREGLRQQVEGRDQERRSSTNRATPSRTTATRSARTTVPVASATATTRNQ